MKNWINLGWLYENNLKDYAKAEEAFLKGIEAGKVNNWNILGWLYEENLKDYYRQYRELQALASRAGFFQYYFIFK